MIDQSRTNLTLLVLSDLINAIWNKYQNYLYNLSELFCCHENESSSMLRQWGRLMVRFQQHPVKNPTWLLFNTINTDPIRTIVTLHTRMLCITSTSYISERGSSELKSFWPKIGIWVYLCLQLINPVSWLHHGFLNNDLMVFGCILASMIFVLAILWHGTWRNWLEFNNCNGGVSDRV